MNNSGKLLPTTVKLSMKDLTNQTFGSTILNLIHDNTRKIAGEMTRSYIQADKSMLNKEVNIFTGEVKENTSNGYDNNIDDEYDLLPSNFMVQYPETKSIFLPHVYIYSSPECTEEFLIAEYPNDILFKNDRALTVDTGFNTIIYPQVCNYAELTLKIGIIVLDPNKP